MAQELSEPDASAEVAGECEEIVSLNAGQAVPESILNPDGTLRCHAVALPLSEALTLRTRSRYLSVVIDKYNYDVEKLLEDRDYYKDGYFRLMRQQEEPTPWIKTRAAARWGGRLETFIAYTTVLLVTKEVYGYDPISS